MERREAIQGLVEWKGQLSDLIAAVSEFPYDSEVPLVTLQADHIQNALRRFLRGEASSAEVQAWADAVEGRDDVEYFELHEEMISEALFQLSTPQIHAALSKEVAEKWLSDLSAL